MRCLIAGHSYVADNSRRDLVKLWAKLNRQINPECDILLVDSASPINPHDFLSEAVTIIRFPDNIGHLNRGGRDGHGRAYIKSLEYAIAEGYDYVLSTDSDLLFARPVLPIFERMKKTGVKAACPLDMTYQFCEQGLSFLDVKWIKDSDYIARYDWENATASILPERKFEELAGDDLWLLPLRGIRNDGNRLNWGNIEQAFPFGWNFATHFADFSLYHKFLRANGITLP